LQTTFFLIQTSSVPAFSVPFDFSQSVQQKVCALSEQFVYIASKGLGEMAVATWAPHVF
jgi:hypothetical protein